MTKNRYEVRYNHRSTETASSKEQALLMVRTEARVAKLALADATDGLYCYRSAADKAADDTGARAFAVICGPGQQQD